MSAARRQAGYSLVELAIAVTLLVIVFALPALLLRTSSRAYSTGARSGEVHLASRRALDRVAERLASSGLEQLGLVPGMPSSDVVFQVATGFAAGETQWGPDERLRLEPEPGETVDGADNDGDGLVDEHRLIWVRDVGLSSERTQVLCSRVRRSLEGELPGNGLDDNGNGLVDEGGLMLALEGERVRIALSIERRDAFGTPIVHTVERAVALRN